MSFFLDMYVLLKTSKTILFGHERARQPKPVAGTKPRHTDIKTETLFLDPMTGSAVDEGDEPEHPRRTQRLS